jgi:hypothetical protein
MGRTNATRQHLARRVEMPRENVAAPSRCAPGATSQKKRDCNIVLRLINSWYYIIVIVNLITITACARRHLPKNISNAK